MKSHTFNDSDTLDRINVMTAALDLLQKSADDLTQDEYDALNNARNFYSGIVNYIWGKKKGMWPAELDRTLDEQVALCREIMDRMFAMQKAEA